MRIPRSVAVVGASHGEGGSYYGSRMMSNLVNVAADPKTIKCDMPVEVVYHKLTDEHTVPLFQPAKGAAR